MHYKEKYRESLKRHPDILALILIPKTGGI